MTAVTDAAVDAAPRAGRRRARAAAGRASPSSPWGARAARSRPWPRDQDHAIVFEDVPEAREPAVQAYFLKLGRFVVRRAGPGRLSPLPGGDHGRESRAGASPSRTWKAYFAELAADGRAQGHPGHSRSSSISGRSTASRSSPAELRRHIDEVLAQEPPFLLHYAQYTLQYKAPLSFFGHIVLEEGKEGRGRSTSRTP
ncbi:MAG: hypothetical protein MZW92_62220 [Comamonadaceae bacterium]|nr:hypothetical protein [Comamonadaceae bacterium]